MALVKCNLCGNNISSRALVCPKCGCPTLIKKDRPLQGAKKCSECENAGVDGNYACNLCDGDSLQAFKAKQKLTGRLQEYEKLQQVPASADIDLLVKIDGLDIDSDLKTVFIKIASTHFRSGLFGIKSYASDSLEFKYFKQLNSLQTVCSNVALLLGPIYYFMHMIWKKGAILLVLQLALFAGVVFGILPVSIACSTALVLLHGVCYCSAKYDRYRKLVLDEEFWW